MENKVPDVVVCSNCNNPVDVDICMAMPDQETPKQQITQIVEPRYPYFSVQCSLCEQYSIFSPFTQNGNHEP